MIIRDLIALVFFYYFFFGYNFLIIFKGIEKNI